MSDTGEFVVYFRSLGPAEAYTSALAFCTGEKADQVAATEILKLTNRGWKRTPYWVPGQSGMSQVMLESETPIGTWNAIVGIVPASYFRALVG